jgi:multidrug transporter EmrE-like cation transporter
MAGFSYSLEDYDLAVRSDLKVVFGNGRHGNGYYELPNHCGLSSTNSVAVGKWSHLAVTLDSTGTGKLWINGSVAVEDYILQLLPPATEPVRIGQVLYTASSPYNGAIIDSFNGLIDDVAIYNRALSAAEVQQLYTAAAGPVVGLIKAVKPSFSNLTVSTNYQLQVSSDMRTWTNTGTMFTATNSYMVYPEYIDVDKWDSLFFRLRVSP